MPRIVRVLALGLLALVVPAQGAATIVAGQCLAFGHHQDAGGGDHGHAQDGAEEHDHAATQDDQGGAGAHCGPCVACCASASIAGSAALPLLPAAADTKYLFSPFPPLGVQPHGLDRPPLAL